MKRNDKPAGVKTTPDTPAPRTNETPRAAKRRGSADKGLWVSRTNPGQTPDTSSADLRPGSAPASASKPRRGTVASGNGGTARPPLHLVKGPPARQGAAQSEPPAPPAYLAGDSATAEDIDALWGDFLAMPALLTLDQVDQVERNGPAGLEAGRTRRAALLMLTKSGAELAALAGGRGSRESIEDVAACLEGYRENLAHLAELMELASARLRLALCEPAAA